MASEEYKHSSYLFHNEKNRRPMQFSMRPCDEREKLKPVIIHGGGTITHKSSKDTIRLAMPGCRVYTDNCISTKWIWDCVKANKRIPIDNYVVKQEDSNSEVSDIDEGDNVIKLGKPKRSPKGKRKEYLLSEDLAIINYIITHRCLREITAKSMWQEMERAKIIKNRSWQSLKERFRKQIRGNLHTYNLSRTHLNYMKQKGDFDLPMAFAPSSPTCSDTSSVKRQSKLYSTDEDLKIIHYVLERNEYDAISGNVYWKQVKRDNILDRTWQSTRERFLKHIVPNLKKYEIDKKYRKKLTNLLDCFGLDNMDVDQYSNEDNDEKVEEPKPVKNNSKNDLPKKILDLDHQKRDLEVESPDFELRLEESDESLDRCRTNTTELRTSKDDKIVEKCREDLVVLDYVPNTNGSPKLQISLFTSKKDNLTMICPDPHLNEILSKYVNPNPYESSSSDTEPMDETEFCEDQFVKSINNLIQLKFAGKTNADGSNEDLMAESSSSVEIQCENDDMQLSPVYEDNETFGKRKRPPNINAHPNKRLNTKNTSTNSETNRNESQNPSDEVNKTISDPQIKISNRFSDVSEFGQIMDRMEQISQANLGDVDLNIKLLGTLFGVTENEVWMLLESTNFNVKLLLQQIVANPT